MWDKTVEQVIEIFNSNRNGLSEKEANQRVLLNGKNEIPKGKKKTILDIFYGQFKSPIILILIIATIFSIIIKSIADAVFILIVICINAVIGTTQEWNSEKSAEKLQNLIKIKTRVLRDGAIKEVDSKDVAIRRYNRIRIWK